MNRKWRGYLDNLLNFRDNMELEGKDSLRVGVRDDGGEVNNIIKNERLKTLKKTKNENFERFQ